MPRILLVEDDADVRFIARHVLADVGHQVDDVGTTREALERLQQRLYDLVLADARLPDGTGFDVADAATARDIKVLLMTGYAFTLPKGTSDGYDILLKPLRPQELIDEVDRALGGPEAP